jgi:HK97 family phage portal protein
MMLHGIKKRLPAEQMVHIRGRMIDVFRVTSNTEMCRGAYALIAAIKNYQTKLFRNFGRHALSFETAEIFGAGAAGEAAFRRLKAQLATGVHKLAEDNTPLLLEAGLSAKLLSMNADDTKADAALLQAQYDICRAHGVPPHKVGLPIIGTYENKQTLEEEYPRSALIPVCTMIERRIEMDVFSERDRRLGYFIEFNRDEIMLASTSSVNTRIEVGMKTATLKVDEAREMMRRNPLGGKAGTGRLAPANMQMVGDNNEVLLKAQLANAGKQDAGDQTGNNETTPGT